jgi:hypothetical protein
MENLYYRQGEILFHRIEVPKNVLPEIKSRYKKVENNVIREGEVSGHMHAVVGDGVLLEVERGTSRRFSVPPADRDSSVPFTSFEVPATADMFISATKSIEITHPEHKSLHLPAGEYIVTIQQEYDELQSRYVAD